MDTYTVIAYIVAAVLFVLAAANVASARVNLIAAGLAAWVSVAMVAAIKNY